MTTSGRDLLERARLLDEHGLVRLAGPGATATADELERPALVATLLSAYTPADRDLIAALTRFEISAVRSDPGRGCGDVLLACCWLLFMIGKVEDTALVWSGKQLNFDTFSYLDSVFLVPAGVPATLAFARSNGLDDLADYVAEPWLGDVAAHADSWRTGTYFDSRPGPDAPAVVLADWIAQ